MYRMYQQTVTRLVLRYFRQYISNIEADFQLSLWGGDVTLHDLDLKLDILNKQIGIDAPFAITRGFIKELKIHIPWSSITTTPVKIILSSVELTLSNNYNTSFNLNNTQNNASNTPYLHSYHHSMNQKTKHGSDGANSIDHISLNNDQLILNNDEINDDEIKYNNQQDNNESITGGLLNNILMR
eukprot:335383_1